MNGVAPLPTIKVNCGQIFSMTATISDSDNEPIDLTAWTGRFRVAEAFDGPAIIDIAPASMTALGVITVNMSAAQTLTLQAYSDNCKLKFQIDADKNDNTDAHRLQGAVMLYPEIGG
jgi:hypothetical protein